MYKQFFSGSAPQCKWRWRLVEEDDVTRRSEPAIEVNELEGMKKYPREYLSFNEFRCI